ncbi:Spo0E family sporulation regulatory protein-aspartic acid phosphatase [Clostridiaceae bacterium M8S5]|nr:Spo0E family sporulation regulatory protein-aspartic acid phosphatase [Clostridiaceae bacterium M8S5]
MNKYIKKGHTKEVIKLSQKLDKYIAIAQKILQH